MTVDAVLQFLMQNPALFFFTGLAVSIVVAVETRRRSVRLPNYGADFILLMLVSLSYIFLNPTPTTGLQRIAGSLADAVLIGSVVGLIFKIVKK